MFERLLRTGASWDWITPVASLIQDWRHRKEGHHTYLITYGQGWSGNQCRRILRRHGIQTWGAMVVNDTIMITVPLPHASYGQHLLDKAGVPVENEPLPGKGKGRRKEIAPSFPVGCVMVAALLVGLALLLAGVYL